MKIKKVGVVGCGIMGSGIIQVCAQSGYEVVVSEINEEIASIALPKCSTFFSSIAISPNPIKLRL